MRIAGWWAETKFGIERNIQDALRAFVINADQGMTEAAQNEGNCERRQGKVRNVSWQNGSLQRKTESVRPFVKPGTHLNVLSMDPVRETNF